MITGALLSLGLLLFWGLRRNPHWRLLVLPAPEKAFQKAPAAVTPIAFPKDLKDLLLFDLDPGDVNTCVLELARRIRQSFPFRLHDVDGYEGEAFAINLEDFARAWRQNPNIKINCGPYANIFCLGCRALGIPARIVATANQTLSEGHVVAEVWDAKRNSWFLVDVLYNCIFLAEGRPLSAIETSRRVRNAQSFDIQRGLAAADPYTTVVRLQQFLQSGLFDQLLIRPGLAPILLWHSTLSKNLWVWRLWFFQTAFALVLISLFKHWLG